MAENDDVFRLDERILSRIDWDCVLFILLPDSDAQSGSPSHPKQISGATNIDSAVPAFLLSVFLPRHTFPVTMALFREKIYAHVIKCFKVLIYVRVYVRFHLLGVPILEDLYSSLNSTFIVSGLEKCKVIELLLDWNVCLWFLNFMEENKKVFFSFKDSEEIFNWTNISIKIRVEFSLEH